jgi:hypothetical protein
VISGPPFERYPGPPPGSGDVYRVISPYRDALAWVSASGRLALAQFLVREGDGWRTVVDARSDPESGGEVSWSLVYRDPVEVVLEATLPGDQPVVASVTVSRAGCDVRLMSDLSSDLLGVLFGEPTRWFRIEPR